MRAVYRPKSNDSYWEERWEEAGADRRTFQRLDFYPVEHAEEVMVEFDSSAKVLEAGCGPGRIFFHLWDQGYDVTAMDFSINAVELVRDIDRTAPVEAADIRSLPFHAGSFDVILAFGVLHNLSAPDDLARAFSEISRVLKPGGKLVFSVRCDSLENHLIEHITRRRREETGPKQLHKLHFTKSDLHYFLNGNGFAVEDLRFERNVSFLFKFDRLRAEHLRGDRFSESQARSGGFQLTPFWNTVDSLLHRLFPRQFSNVLVATAAKRA